MQNYSEDRSQEWQCSDREEAFAEILDAVQDVLAAMDDVTYLKSYAAQHFTNNLKEGRDRSLSPKQSTHNT